MAEPSGSKQPLVCEVRRSGRKDIALRDIVRLARPAQWIKNGVVILPILFARKMTDPHAWLMILGATAAFCLASSAIYAINDIRDCDMDRLHPLKRMRPVACGRISARGAGLVSGFFAGGAVCLAPAVNRMVLAAVLCYLLLQLAYIFEFKQRPILDVMCIALGFVLRAIAGVFALRVEITSWLIVCVFTLCLFMGFCKRWNEISVLANDPRALTCRKTLSRYSPEILTHLVTLSATIAIISYLLYVLSPVTVERFGTQALVYTLPVVMYGVCRFAMVSMEGRYADPVALFLHDKPMMATAVLWLTCVAFIVNMGGRMSAGIHAPP